MSESVNLMQLQDIDLQLLKLASNLASMPQVQKIKNAQLAEKKIASQLKQVLGVKKDVEIDISDRMKKARSRSNEVQQSTAD